ncbi:hypothetical protein BD626DRAFT_406536 [Schizophyllum amplum]|uniref:SWIM-type domain-containing protein n=1 Tax=Schizophyllum amplum TaxID=97359 RepID=A0A550C7Z0_9AGAR|nr:hypothetical protein BD626DRAFT_406536 [Auriculariopsis ampla]
MLDCRLQDIGRFREQAARRADFKSEWRKLEQREVIEENDQRLVSDAYRPDPIKWVCGCRAFVRSRFLICKHLVNCVQRVPPVFFYEVKRSRDVPFWSHPDLKPIESGDVGSNESASDEDEGQGGEERGGTRGWRRSPTFDADNDLLEVIEQTNDELEDADNIGGLRTYTEESSDIVSTLRAFADGIEYNAQFRDRRFLETVQREGVGFLRLAQECLDKERRMQSLRGGGTRPSTWQEASSAMFYRPRPRACDVST